MNALMSLFSRRGSNRDHCFSFGAFKLIISLLHLSFHNRINSQECSISGICHKWHAMVRTFLVLFA